VLQEYFRKALQLLYRPCHGAVDLVHLRDIGSIGLARVGDDEADGYPGLAIAYYFEVRMPKCGV